MRTPAESYVDFNPDVVDADVPFLISLDLLENHGLALDFSRRIILKRHKAWELPMIFKYGHIFIEWGPKSICPTKA